MSGESNLAVVRYNQGINAHEYFLSSSSTSYLRCSVVRFEPETIILPKSSGLLDTC
jgi:hypothetical protein